MPIKLIKRGIIKRQKDRLKIIPLNHKIRVLSKTLNKMKINNHIISNKIKFLSRIKHGDILIKTIIVKLKII